MPFSELFFGKVSLHPAPHGEMGGFFVSSLLFEGLDRRQFTGQGLRGSSFFQPPPGRNAAFFPFENGRCFSNDIVSSL